MSDTINQYISQNNVVGAFSECLRSEQYYLGLLLARAYQDVINTPKLRLLVAQLEKAVLGIQTDGQVVEVKEDVIDATNEPLLEPEPTPEPTPVVAKQPIDSSKTRLLLLCNWCDSKTLCDTWNKMSQGNYIWNNIQIVWEEPCDYYVVINCPPITIFPDTRKTILFQMEPHMDRNGHKWGDWAVPPKDSFKFRGMHSTEYNNNEWHLSKTYQQLKTEQIKKNDDLSSVLSTVLSDKYNDPGHVKRIDFIKFMERKGEQVHVFGGNKFEWQNYKGSPPYHAKDEAILPYKYVFNAENHEIRNYYTEKLIDGILGECLVFYWGCPNIRDFIDPRAFVQLELVDFEKDCQKIKQAISENWWEQRLPYIKEAKKKILEELQFFPRLERILAK